MPAESNANTPLSSKQARHRKWLLRLTGGALFVVVVAVVLLLLPGRQFGGWDFRVNLWGPAYLLVHGGSPYRTRGLGAVDPLFEKVNAIWLPPAIGVLFPLGCLDAYRASNLWLLANILLVLLIIEWVREKKPIPRPLLIVTPVLLILFPPLLSHLILGQFSLLIVLLLLLAARLLEQHRFIWAGLAVVLVLTKPQLGVLALPGLWVASFRLGGKRTGWAFAGAASLGTAVSTIPLWIASPYWVADLLQALRGNPFWYQPTLFTNLQLLWGRAGWILPGLLAVGVLLLNLWLWWRYPPEEVIPWSMALTTIASPYIWTWDFVLFLPLVLRSLFRQRTWQARAIWIGGLLLCSGLASWIRLAFLAVDDQRHHVYAWIPWLLLLITFAAHAAESRFSPAGRPPLLQR